MIPHNRHSYPVAPLQGEYTEPAPPRHSIPGTKTAKDKAGHTCLSVVCSVALVVVFLLSTTQQIDRCFSLVLVPLGIGALWGLLPVAQDILITLHLGRHSITYNTIHLANAEELRNVSAEWSAKHNGATTYKQIIETTQAEKQERLEAENRRLLQLVTKMRGGVWDLDTEHLDDL